MIYAKKYVAGSLPASIVEGREIICSDFFLVKLDAKDESILASLASDATQPLYSIAEASGLTSDVVRYRMANMKEACVFRSFVQMIDYSFLGYSIYIVLMNINSLDDRKEARLRTFLQASRHTLWAIKAIGNYNLLMYLCVNRTADLYEVIHGLRDMYAADVKDYEILVNYEEQKYTYYPLICNPFK